MLSESNFSFNGKSRKQHNKHSSFIFINFQSTLALTVCRNWCHMQIRNNSPFQLWNSIHMENNEFTSNCSFYGNSMTRCERHCFLLFWLIFSQLKLKQCAEIQFEGESVSVIGGIHAVRNNSKVTFHYIYIQGNTIKDTVFCALMKFYSILVTTDCRNG